jgi:hypothetical protein
MLRYGTLRTVSLGPSRKFHILFIQPIEVSADGELTFLAQTGGGGDLHIT